jgi:alpha-beta hydrolase superfamily lysophospholipase
MLQLVTYEFPAVGEARGLLFFLSDCEFNSKYLTHLVKDFASHGFRVFSFEHRGFGGSEGPKELLDENAITDTWAFIDEALTFSKMDNLPKFVMGYCTSALVAAILCEEKPNFFQGCM